MRRTLLALFIGSIALPALAAHRVAVIVGANTGVAGRETLRYSANDAQSLADVLISAGEFKAQDVHVLLDPEPAKVIGQLDSLLNAAGQRGDETLLLFYYSGHADDRALYPAGRPLLFSELRKRLADSRAAVRIGIIDACRGGAWTRAKGLNAEPPFEVNIPLDVATEGSVMIASSSGEESAHEADALRGSFFTHHLVAGLRGAADTSGNGRITLNEAFAYAQRYTVRDTTRLAQAPQHPSFDTQLHGRSDIALTRTETAPSLVALEQTEGPLQLVQLSTGVVLLELPPGERTVKLAIPPGAYLVRRLGLKASWTREIQVESGKPLVIPEASLELTPNALLANKGFEEPPLREGEFRLLVHLLPERKGMFIRELETGLAVCGSPCDRKLILRSTQLFRIEGTGMTESGSFNFMPRDGEVTLQVKPGKLWMAPAGSAAIAVGGTSLLVATVLTSLGTPGDISGTATQQRLVRQAELRNDAFLVGGLAMILFGGLLIHYAPTTWESH